MFRCSPNLQRKHCLEMSPRNVYRSLVQHICKNGPETGHFFVTKALWIVQCREIISWWDFVNKMIYFNTDCHNLGFHTCLNFFWGGGGGGLGLQFGNCWKLCYAQAHHIEHRKLPVKSAAAEIIKIKLAITNISLCCHLLSSQIRLYLEVW